jgi:hypothetical protein
METWKEERRFDQKPSKTNTAPTCQNNSTIYNYSNELSSPLHSKAILSSHPVEQTSLVLTFPLYHEKTEAL